MTHTQTNKLVWFSISLPWVRLGYVTSACTCTGFVIEFASCLSLHKKQMNLGSDKAWYSTRASPASAIKTSAKRLQLALNWAGVIASNALLNWPLRYFAFNAWYAEEVNPMILFMLFEFWVIIESSQNGVCLVGTASPPHIGVIWTHLELPRCHIHPSSEIVVYPTISEIVYQNIILYQMGRLEITKMIEE